MSAATLTAALARAARNPDVGLRFVDRAEREERLPWPEVVERSLAAGGSLAAAGVRPGDRVALVHPTGPEFVVALFATVLAGAVPVPLYPPLRLGRLDEYHRRTGRMLSQVGARLVLADRRVGRILGEAVATARPPLGLRRLDELPRGSADPVDAAADDLALVQFSSGTTVAPKPVALSHRALMAQVRALNGFWPDTAEVRHSGCSWLPLYHDMGLVGCLFAALERPGELTLIGPELFVARPAIWLRVLGRSRATISPAPNFAYSLCVDRVRDEELDGVDLSAWRVALNGAEAVAPGVLRRFVDRFARWGLRREALTPVYGLSEACLAVTFSAVDRPFVTRAFDRAALAEGRARDEEGGLELVSVGRPLPGFAVEVRDGEGVPLPERRVGRLWVRGPSLMEGYLGRPEATAETLVDGWLDTGDRGFLVAGELYLTGRAKDVVILRGRNYAPEEIERAIDRVPGVRRGCAAAVSLLPEGGEREVLALLVEHRRDAGEGEIAALAGACRRAVLAATGLAADRVEVLAPGTLPRTSSGKIRRAAAREALAAGALEPPDRVGPLRLAREVARSQLALVRWRLAGGDDD